MKNEFEGCVVSFDSNNVGGNYSPYSAMLTVESYDYANDSVDFRVPVEDIAQWNGKKIRVTIETVEEEQS